MNKTIIFSLLLLCSSMLTIAAQETATVKSFKMTTDHIPSGDRRNDMNGNPCALVKVQVVDDIERVEGNKIGDIIVKGVEKWIYMCKGSRNVRIHLRNHLPIKVEFPKYKINGLESNRVYELVINANTSKPVMTSFDEGNYLQMKVIPSKARFVIWSENMAKRIVDPDLNGYLREFLPYGRYYFWAEAPGYLRKDSSVFVNDENVVTEVRLEPEMGTLVISCNTDKADFFVNGIKADRKRGKSWTTQLPPSQYLVEARAKGYVAQLKKVIVRPNETLNVQFLDLVSDREQKKLGNATPDDAAMLREEIMKKREEALAKERKAIENAKAKAELMRKANSYDKVYMLDKSYILCTVEDSRDKVLLIKQKGNDNLLRVPVREIDHIQYFNGDLESFK